MIEQLCTRCPFESIQMQCLFVKAFKHRLAGHQGSVVISYRIYATAYAKISFLGHKAIYSHFWFCKLSVLNIVIL